jgi:hypothetical protein
MRFALALALAFASVSLFAEDGAKPAAATAAKAVNTVCPCDGDKVDPNVAPVTGKTKDGKTVEIGACCAKCAAKIKENPDAYADAAVANKKVEEKATK